MSTTKIHDFAQKDTPSVVEVPKSWPGLIVWAVGRFGATVLVAAVFWHAWREERNESRVQNAQMVTILEQRARVDTEMTQTLVQLRTSIDEMRRDASEAHRAFR